jgi:hypothetical protein
MEILRKSEDATSSELVLAYNLRFSEVWKRLRFTSSKSTTFGTLEYNYTTNNALCGGDDPRPFWPKIIAGYELNVSGRCWCVTVRNNWSIVFCQLWISIEEMVYCTTGISIRMKGISKKWSIHTTGISIEESVYSTCCGNRSKKWSIVRLGFRSNTMVLSYGFRSKNFVVHSFKSEECSQNNSTDNQERP